jgi:hypothetical protein
MKIVFDSQEELVRLARMVKHGIEEADANIADRILLMGIKNILTFFLIKIEKGVVQVEWNVTSTVKQISAPGTKRKGRK